MKWHDDWPRDELGRYICNRENPRPDDRPWLGYVWVHMLAEQLEAPDVWRCPVCFATWREPHTRKG